MTETEAERAPRRALDDPAILARAARMIRDARARRLFNEADLDAPTVAGGNDAECLRPEHATKPPADA